MGVQFQPPNWTHTQTMLVYLMCLSFLVTGLEGKRKFNGGRARGGKSAERSWHVAGPEGESTCGNYTETELYTGEPPSTACTEIGTAFCICGTRDDLEGEQIEWRFTCGTCELKWKPTRDEDDKKKRISAEAKKKKKEMRMKMRMKLKSQNTRKEKL